MFPIDQVVTRGLPLLQAILKPGPEVNTHIWAQVPKLILKGKGVDPLERGGAVEAGGSKLEGKQVSDGNQGRKGGEKGKKKEKKEKKEKKIERVAMGSDGGKGGLQSIPASKATPGAVEGSSPSPGTSKGSIPRPFQRPNSSICLGDFEATGYPLKRGPKLGTWPFPIKEGQGLGLHIEAKDAFGHPKGKIQ
ncbi:hypothetical protein PAXRUDRAFT_22920 [Paxillus rubicundulus Ve08.2h10]|uniref:Uncharacterized protein n=1 Tax=Paxillus rubicundulus Ve08.2h10 TaxID=930991 RepID=A0A0D0D4H4_9AGAM|nr:hypothetical protein PAXRUDRAFT_22920 [Paxillus rubicundulus Ve08.2h10]